MARMLNVLLGRTWDGHAEGEIVTVEDFTAHSMVKKGYGEIVNKRQAAKIEAQAERRPPVETADATPAAEQAAVQPIVGAPSFSKGGD